MGLMLSLLVSCAGVIEAIACYQSIRYGLAPCRKPSLDTLKKNYDTMFAESLQKSKSRSETWKLGTQGYLEIKGGGRSGPIKATIKYLGEDRDPTPSLFSTKISSFGQESVDENASSYTPRKSPERTIKTQIPQSNGSSIYLENRLTPTSSRENVSKGFWEEDADESKRESSPNFWDDDADDTSKEPEPKEKIQWHYRPLTPTNESALPEIHFDSYERKYNQDEGSANSEDFLRSLDGIKLRPLQRDDGTGRRRSFKKRHSSSSTSSRESKASREEELKIFTSLEESEFESYKDQPNFGSAPNLSVGVHAKKSKSPQRLTPNSSRESKSPSIERPHLKNIPKNKSFDEESEIVDDDAICEDKDSSLSTQDIDEDSGTVFRKTGVNW